MMTMATSEQPKKSSILSGNIIDKISGAEGGPLSRITQASSSATSATSNPDPEKKGMLLSLVEETRQTWKDVRLDILSGFVGENIGTTIKYMVRERMKKRGL